MVLEQTVSGGLYDVYYLRENRNLVIATDRLSRNVVLADSIPDKGAIFNQIAKYWIDFLYEAVPGVNSQAAYPGIPQCFHADFEKEDLPSLEPRAMTMHNVKLFPFVCHVSGYDGQSVLAQPHMTFYADKNGSEEQLSLEQVTEIVGRGNPYVDQIITLSPQIYEAASKHAATKGLIVGSTKLQYGLVMHEEPERFLLCNDILTPASSTYWDVNSQENGSHKITYDNSTLESWFHSNSNVDHSKANVPEDILQTLRKRYLTLYQKLTGQEWKKV